MEDSESCRVPRGCCACTAEPARLRALLLPAAAEEEAKEDEEEDRPLESPEAGALGKAERLCSALPEKPDAAAAAAAAASAEELPPELLLLWSLKTMYL